MLWTVKTNRGPELTRSARLRDEVGVNAAYLQEIKDDERQVPMLLEVVGNGMFVESWDAAHADEMRTLLRRLYQQVKYRFHLEEALGYMTDVVQVAPRLCRKAESLRSEHQPLLDQLQQLVELSHSAFLDQRVSKQGMASIRDAFLRFHDRYQSHEMRENDLIVESLYLDIGGGD